MTVLTSALEGKMDVTCCCQPQIPETEKDKTVWRFVKKIFLSQVFRSLRSKKDKPTTDSKSPKSLRRESFYLSTVSLEKRRPSEQSIDTIITLLDEHYTLDNRVNEKIEEMTLIDGLV